MKQTSFAQAEYDNKKRKTRREKFLETMDKAIPWVELEGVIEPYYYKNSRGRKAYPLSVMFVYT
jgi:hypothetical protein